MIATSIGLVLAGALASSASPAPELCEKEPYQWVRTLEAVQERIGRGSRAAHTYLPKLIGEIAKEIDKVDTERLLQERNVRAVLVYTLSGGESRIVRKLLGLGRLDPSQETIAKGALAYSEGKYAKASEYLAAVDPRVLEPSLAGQVALTQSILAYKRDPQQAIAKLELARLLAVGTLVEEAALRREVVLAGTIRDHDRFAKVSKQYFLRFGKSVYAGHFKRQFSMAASSLDFGGGPERLEILRTIVDELGPGERLSLYLLLAETAIFVGNVPLAEFAAKGAEKLSGAGSSERLRTTLYWASAAVVTSETERAMSELGALKPSELEPSDEGLRRAALAVGQNVLRPPASIAILPEEKVGDAGQREAGRQPSASSPDAGSELGAALETAKKVIETADGLLGGKR